MYLYLACNAEDELDVDSKRFKGIGIGAPDGPISLDDVRSLQRSNTVVLITLFRRSLVDLLFWLMEMPWQFKLAGT